MLNIYGYLRQSDLRLKIRPISERNCIKVERNRNNTCFFTGHRRIPKTDSNNLVSATDAAIESLITDGYEYFVCGGAVGFDTLAACRVVVAQRHHRNIKLILALPCRDQTLRWHNTYDISLYQRLKGYASDIMYASDIYSHDCMHVRNRMMADMSSVCIAYFNGSSGGTAYTVNYAEKFGIRVINICK